jgi:hypothetical protein
MDDGCEGLSHVWRRSKLLDEVTSTNNLIAHRGDNIINRYLSFFVDERLGPNFGVDLALGVKVLAYVVLVLSDLV